MEYAMDFPESILTEIFPIRSSNMQAFHLTKASFIFAKLNNPQKANDETNLSEVLTIRLFRV